MVHIARTVGRSSDVVEGSFESQMVLDHRVDGIEEPICLGVGDLGGDGERRQLCHVKDFVRQQAPESRQSPLVSQTTMKSGVPGPECGLKLFSGEGVGVGPEMVDWFLLERIAHYQPDPGLVLGACLGEQQGTPIGEFPAGHSAPWPLGLLGVGPQASPLHQVEDEGETVVVAVIIEVQEQVLASVPRGGEDPPVGLIGPGCEGFERREVKRSEHR